MRIMEVCMKVCSIIVKRIFKMSGFIKDENISWKTLMEIWVRTQRGKNEDH